MSLHTQLDTQLHALSGILAEGANLTPVLDLYARVTPFAFFLTGCFLKFPVNTSLKHYTHSENKAGGTETSADPPRLNYMLTERTHTNIKAKSDYL